MYKVIRFIMLTVAMIVGASTMSGQTKDGKRPTREQLAEKQAQYIADQLALDDKTAAKLTTVYCNCQREVWALGPRIGKSENTEAESESRIKQRFERSQKILEIREKYYAEYSKFLTQKQIERVYQLERQMMKRLSDKKHSVAHKRRNR